MLNSKELDCFLIQFWIYFCSQTYEICRCSCWKLCNWTVLSTFVVKAEDISEKTVKGGVLRKISLWDSPRKSKNCLPETTIVYNSICNPFIENRKLLFDFKSLQQIGCQCYVFMFENWPEKCIRKLHVFEQRIWEPSKLCTS